MKFECCDPESGAASEVCERRRVLNWTLPITPSTLVPRVSVPDGVDTSNLTAFKPKGLAAVTVVATMQGTLKGRDAVLAWSVLLVSLAIVFCLFLGSINSYFVTALQGGTDYSWKSTFAATGGEEDTLSDVCLVVVLVLFPFLQIASIIRVTSFNESAHVWLLLRCMLRARPQLKKSGWVPSIWLAVAGEVKFVVGMIHPMLCFSTAAYVALSTTFNFYSVATASLVGKFILELDERALELVEAYRFSNGAPSLADCAVVFVGKDADTACKKLIKRVGLVLGLSEVAILVAAKSLLTTKLLLAVPVTGSMSMLLYEYPFTRIGRRAKMHWLITAFGAITYAGLVALHQYAELA